MRDEARDKIVKRAPGFETGAVVKQLPTGDTLSNEW
jgi:hypothetical protein